LAGRRTGEPRRALLRGDVPAHERRCVVAHGCNCNRQTVEAIRSAGFAIEQLEHDRIQKVPTFVSPLVVGSAEAA
jgi:hypothetical protein